MENTKNNGLKQFLEKSYGKAFSDIKVKQSKDRLISFFGLLIEIDQKVSKEKKYGNIRNTNSAN